MFLTRLNRRAIGISAAGFACFITLYSTQPMMPVLAHDFAVPLPETGLTITASLVAVALLAPLVGAISDMFGRKRLIFGAAMLLSVPTLLAAITTSYTAFLLCRFAQGLAMPFIFAVVIAYITEEWAGPEAMRLTGVYQMASIVSGLFGRVVSGAMTDFVGWRMAFVANAACILVCAALIGWGLPRERKFVPVRGLAAGFRMYGTLLRQKKLLATFALGFTMLFSIVSAYTFASVYLSQPPFSLAPGPLGAVFAAYLVGTITTGFAARLARRLGRRESVAVWVGVAVCGILLTLVPWLPAIVAGLGLVAGGIFPNQTLSLNFVATTGGRGKSTALGIYTTFYYLGGAIGAIAPAAIWREAGWSGCVAMFIALQCFVLGVALSFWREDGPPKLAPI